MSSDIPKISIDAIDSAPMPVPTEVIKPVGQDPFTGRDSKLDQHLGRVGAFIGGGPEKAGNIAYVTVAVSFTILVIGGIISGLTGSEKVAAVYDHLVTGALSLITGALGYLFGSSSK